MRSALGATVSRFGGKLGREKADVARDQVRKTKLDDILDIRVTDAMKAVSNLDEPIDSIFSML